MHSKSQQFRRSSRAKCAALLLPLVAMSLLGLCSCQTAPELGRGDPFGHITPPAVANAGALAEPEGRRADALDSSMPWGANDRAGVDPSGSDAQGFAAVVPASASAGPHNPVQLVGHFESPGRGARSAVDFSAAEPRVPMPAFAGGVAPAAAWNESPAGEFGAPHCPQVPFRDEYLCDGGDRGLPIHYDVFNRLGFETEDTVAEYRDHLGEDHVLPSNRVCIYAPRFGAVRTVSGPASGVGIDQLAQAGDAMYVVGMRNLAGPNYHSQRETTEGVRVRSRASGLESEEGGITFEQTEYVTEHQELLNAFEDIRYEGFDELLQADKAQIAYLVQAALVWTRDLYPVITAGTRAGQEVNAQFKVQELVGAEDQRGPGRLRIIKLADKKIAEPGEEVSFTIRYENLGDRELVQVRIVDNLTPRLEYLPDTATSDRPGQFFFEDNGEGSVILRFELKNDLPGHSGGTISFQARVR